MNQQLISRYSL